MASVPKNKPLPSKTKKTPQGSGGAGDAALVAIGHNSRGQSKFLLAEVNNIEVLEEKRRALGKQINGHYATIKANGFSVQAVRRVVALRRMDKDERRHLEENIAIAKEALGMQLTFDDRLAMGEEPSEAELTHDESDDALPSAEQVALKRGAAASIEPSTATLQ